jgi:hypothetical protein
MFGHKVKVSLESPHFMAWILISGFVTGHDFSRAANTAKIAGL